MGPQRVKVNNKEREINEQSLNINSKCQNLMSKLNDTKSTRRIRDYPMIKTTLGRLRKDELKKSTYKKRAKLSFIKLFEYRLNQIQGDREMVSINLDVEINTSVGRDENYERLPKHASKGEKDEYGIKYKRVFKQTLLLGKDDEKFIRKNYGPFTVEKPVNLSEDDVYKFGMYTLLKNKFTILSEDFITGIGCKIIKLRKKQFKNHKMGNLKLESYLLNK